MDKTSLLILLPFVHTLRRRGDDQEHLEDEDDEGLGAVEGGEVEEEVVNDAEVRRD